MTYCSLDESQYCTHTYADKHTKYSRVARGMLAAVTCTAPSSGYPRREQNAVWNRLTTHRPCVRIILYRSGRVLDFPTVRVRSRRRWRCRNNASIVSWSLVSHAHLIGRVGLGRFPRRVRAARLSYRVRLLEFRGFPGFRPNTGRRRS